MDAKTFAPALFATASLVERASAVLYPNGETLTVQVNADFKHGSFVYDLSAAIVVPQRLLRRLQ